MVLGTQNPIALEALRGVHDSMAKGTQRHMARGRLLHDVMGQQMHVDVDV